ncbi:MAG TPA: deoxyribodipyrimidine photo-lyase [Verrucomicrobiae bacterium]|jgi:deoxyribodipyrimidine photo-lyase|nr:deoxyribodipyrimidine photo-lyase [Verrucomicrobiae bacterium]
MSPAPIILWFRIDLRLADNPALCAALSTGAPVIPVFIFSPEEEAPWQPGAASRWWLHQLLLELQTNLERAGAKLIIRRGPTLAALRELIEQTGVRTIFWNRRYEPAIISRDKKIHDALASTGIKVESFSAALLHEPGTVLNQSGKPFQVFTPFWRHCLKLSDPATPLPAPKTIHAPKKWPATLTLNALELEPKIPWAKGFRNEWTPGETGAQSQLQKFLHDAFPDYSTARNRPDRRGTSRLSPHLHFGEISPRQVWHAIRRDAEKKSLAVSAWRESQFLTELGWREFAHQLLIHFPQAPTKPLRPNFAKFPWRVDAEFLQAWQRGKTGYPIVDAGMRELWATGWMHNRVRMIAGSFLVKDLLLSWQEGANWFWDTLVDADLAQNTLGWQWIAGCGADAAPYFRIFNPITQGEKFDPQGDYVRRWCPELTRLPGKWLHQPWRAPAKILSQAGVELGRDYPEPIVSHAIAREVALAAFAKIKNG